MTKPLDHDARFQLVSISDRAVRLKAEASNCIAVALEGANDPFVADLIDEAAKLWKRALEIGGKPLRTCPSPWGESRRALAGTDAAGTA